MAVPLFPTRSDISTLDALEARLPDNHFLVTERTAKALAEARVVHVYPKLATLLQRSANE